MTSRFCLSYLIFQQQYVIQFSFIIHMCKRLLSSGIFFIFSNILFWESLGEKGKNILYVSLCISGTVSHIIVIFSTHVQKDDISSNVFQFFVIVLLGDFRGGKRGKNDLKLPISVCHALYLRNFRSYHGDFWYTGVK